MQTARELHLIDSSYLTVATCLWLFVPDNARAANRVSRPQPRSLDILYRQRGTRPLVLLGDLTCCSVLASNPGCLFPTAFAIEYRHQWPDILTPPSRAQAAARMNPTQQPSSSDP